MRGRGVRRAGGVTLVEMIITIAVMSVIMLTAIPLFNVTSRGYSRMEVGTVLSAGTQLAMTRIQNRVTESKRLFGNDAAGNSFLSRVTTANLSPAPGALSGSRLPVITSSMSFSPSSTFTASNVGNSLFFASVDAPLALDNISNGVSTGPVRVDCYIFDYYFLAPDNAQRIAGQTIRDLWEWHSDRYADFQQLNAITNPTKRANAIAAVYAAGVLYAFDVGAADATTAFYTTSPGGTLTFFAGHNIARNPGNDPPSKMIKVIRGAASGGFRYSVSPNTGGSFTHNYTVPGFAAASGNFPSGFETMVSGPSSVRRVFVRIVIAAQGNFKGYPAFEHVLFVTTRDLY